MGTATGVSLPAKSGESPAWIQARAGNGVAVAVFATERNVIEFSTISRSSEVVLPEASSSGNTSRADLDAAREPVRGALRRLDEKIRKLLHTDTSFIGEVSSYIITGRGKRIRPTLLLLAAGAFADEISDDGIALAAAVEFIHGATLLHDDVVDTSAMRRGQPTANQCWGNESSVLVGDFLYSRAFQVMVQHASIEAMKVMADTTNKIAEGEVQQLVTRDNLVLDKQRYLDVIAAKTACLFSAAARLGAMVAGADARYWQVMADYGFATGMAYQLVDDVLDYDASLEETGKNHGDDIREGKLTMPLFYALDADNSGKLAELVAVMKSKDVADDIVGMVRAGDAIGRTMELARSHAETARLLLSGLPAGECTEALRALTVFSTERRF